MISPWLGILAVLLTLAAMFGLLKLAERLFHPHPELLRKFMHVGMGLIVACFPWVFAERWPVLLLAGLTAAGLLAVKYVPSLRDGVGSVLSAVGRRSFGEILFPAAVAALILLSRGDKLLFVVPMLIMVLADTVAALVGLAYGKVRYLTSDGFKSAEGSIAFFTIAFFSVHVPILLFRPDVGRPESLLIAAIIGLLAMLIEAISAHGLDNFLIPVGAFGFLRLYLHATQHALLIRLAATVALLGFALSWRRRSTLDDSALIACALFGYGVAMLGGPVWMIGPAALFLIHAWMWPRTHPDREHTIYAVASVAFVALLWLGLEVAWGDGWEFLFPYAVGFSAHLAIIGVSQLAVDSPPRKIRAHVTVSILAGVALLAVQMAPFFLHVGTTHLLSRSGVILGFGLCGISAGAVGFLLLMPRIYGEHRSIARIHLAGFSCALLATVIAATALPVLVNDVPTSKPFKALEGRGG